MSMSGDSALRRFDLVAETRRRWDDAEKIAIVREASVRSVNVSAVARRHGIKPSLLFRWKKQFSGADAVPVFAAVTVSAPPVANDEPPPSTTGARPSVRKPANTNARGMIEVELANGRRVRIDASVDLDVLARIIAVLDMPR